MPLHDYKGCLHVHSTYSDGDATLPEILDAAREAGLDYLVLSDHTTLQARDDGWEGWHDGVLLAVGTEINAGRHHCMALGLHELDGARCTRTAERLEAIRRDGGLAFVVHPRPVHKPLFKVWVPGWTDWHLDTFQGIEIWPYLHDWIRSLRPWNFLSHCRQPDRWVRGPEPAVLRHWDELGRRRRCVGLGALDNHARRLPFRRWGPALIEVFPHAYAFRTVRTHLVSPEPFSGTAGDLSRVYSLLAEGRCYVSYDLLADATGFRFWAERGGLAAQMGDEVAAGEPFDFHASCPADAELRLLRDGQPVATARGRELAARDAVPGVYRVEARLDGRPWIFSNPIYVREGRAGM
jgi:hypothetical protein